MFQLFFRPKAEGQAQRLYRTVVLQARHSAFYIDFEVPDTPDGRFDMISLHMVLVLRRLRQTAADPGIEGLAQALFDLMFADMDQNLREMGVGDLAVGKRIKGMVQGFYGRVNAYDQALAADDGEVALAAALRRNLYRKASPTTAAVRAMAAYVRREAAALDGQAIERLAAGDVRFGVPWALESRALP